MSRRIALCLGVVGLIGAAGPSAVSAQADPDVPRAPSGRPDLSGTYDTATVTPLQRPREFGDRLTLTREEAAIIASDPDGLAKAFNLAPAGSDERAAARAAEQRAGFETGDGDREAPPAGGDGSGGAAGNVGGYNTFWIDRGEAAFRIDGLVRTSIITDPPDGRQPPLTDGARAARAARAGLARSNDGTAWWLEDDLDAPGPYDHPEQRPHAERCLMGFGSTAGPPMLSVLYNNMKRIVQTDDTVMILVEMVHDARIVLQRLANGLTAGKVDALLRKWLARLPHPFTAPDRQQGIRYDISILQAEFALTQVFERPAQGRVFFEEVVRENLDMGRPDHVQLIFDRRVNRRTPSRYRTRVITDGVTPSLHVDYKHSRIKQYHKEGRALRTETVINDTYDFDVGRRLRNLDDLKKIGFAANRRLLGVQRLSHDCILGADVLDELHRPVTIDGQRASALRFGDRRVQSLFAALLRFDLLPQGFRNRELRETVASLCGLSPDDYGTGRMTYDLRRLRLRGIIERIPRIQRYRVTAEGLCVALAYHRTQARVLGPVLSATLDGESTTRLREAVALYDREVDRAWNGRALAA